MVGREESVEPSTVKGRGEGLTYVAGAPAFAKKCVLLKKCVHNATPSAGGWERVEYAAVAPPHSCPSPHA